MYDAMNHEFAKVIIKGIREQESNPEVDAEKYWKTYIPWQRPNKAKDIFRRAILEDCNQEAAVNCLDGLIAPTDPEVIQQE